MSTGVSRSAIDFAAQAIVSAVGQHCCHVSVLLTHVRARSLQSDAVMSLMRCLSPNPSQLDRVRYENCKAGFSLLHDNLK
jgi:hypothetical protein